MLKPKTPPPTTPKPATNGATPVHDSPPRGSGMWDNREQNRRAWAVAHVVKRLQGTPPNINSVIGPDSKSFRRDSLEVIEMSNELLLWIEEGDRVIDFDA